MESKRINNANGNLSYIYENNSALNVSTHTHTSTYVHTHHMYERIKALQIDALGKINMNS